MRALKEFGSVQRLWQRADMSAFCCFLQSSSGLGEREVVTLDRWDSDISLQALEGKGLGAPAVSRSFSLPFKCKTKAVLAELRTLQSDSSALRSSVGTVLLL